MVVSVLKINLLFERKKNMPYIIIQLDYLYISLLSFLNRFKENRCGLCDLGSVHAAHQASPEGQGIRPPRQIQTLGGCGQQTGLCIHRQWAPGQVLL